MKSRPPFYFRILPNESHVAALVDRLLALEPSDEEFDDFEEYDDDDEVPGDRRFVIEVVVTDEPEEERLFLFREGAQLGIRLADTDFNEAWWLRHGFRRIEGEPFVDPDTYEEKLVHGEPVRFPLSRGDAIALTVSALRDYLQFPVHQVFLATDQGNTNTGNRTVGSLVAARHGSPAVAAHGSGSFLTASTFVSSVI